jgi:toxin ParE1/3/4
MTRRVSIRATAKKDVKAARDWYERQRRGLGEEFLASIAEVFSRLEEAPEQFPLYYRDFRRAIANRFPYKVFCEFTAIPLSSLAFCTPRATT